MLLPPDEITAKLRSQYPDLADHPVWDDLIEAIARDRRAINQIFQQEQGNTSEMFRRRIEALLHPKP